MRLDIGRLKRGQTNDISKLPVNAHRELLSILEYYPDSVKIYLFGSYFRGTYDENTSDIDIIISDPNFVIRDNNIPKYIAKYVPKVDITYSYISRNVPNGLLLQKDKI